jgi:hypothetical protein
MMMNEYLSQIQASSTDDESSFVPYDRLTVTAVTVITTLLHKAQE